MKKINSVVRGLLVVLLAFASVALPSGKVFAAENDSLSLPEVYAHGIVTNGTTNYVSDFNSTDVLTGTIPAGYDSYETAGDGAYGMSFVGGHLFVAAGKGENLAVKSVEGDSLIPPCSINSGGLQVFASTDISTPLSFYGSCGYTYSKVSVVGSTAYVALLDSSYAPQLDVVSYSDTSNPTIISRITLGPVSSAADITDLAVSGDYAYVAVQDDGSGEYGGVVNVVDISTPPADFTKGAVILPPAYYTADAVTAVTAYGNLFYVGHGNTIDVVDATTLGQTNTIDTGATVNGLFTDGTYLYVANENGLKIYNLSDLSLVGKYDTDMNATAVTADGGYIYLATSDGSNSTIFKIKMVVISLNGDNPQTVEYGGGTAAYEGPVATVNDDNFTVVNDADTAFTDAIGTYTITYTAIEKPLIENLVDVVVPNLSVEKIVNVVDTTAPVITLNGDNPMRIKRGFTAVFSDVDPGATTDDGSVIQTDYSDFVDKNGSYFITYDAVDASGNHAEQVVRKVIVGTVTGGGSGGGSGSGTTGNNGGNPTNPGNGQVLGAEKFIFTLFLKMGSSPFPGGAYANEVMELQKFLNKAPYNSGLTVDGKFGPKTNAAVIKFQLANGLVGDGLVGPLTRAVLNK